MTTHFTVIDELNVKIDRCKYCPIKDTEYCHKVNPMAKKYTRSEKKELRKAIDKGQTAFNEAKCQSSATVQNVIAYQIVPFANLATKE